MSQERRPHERSQTVKVFGRSRCYITCPFCQTTCLAYTWSLAGGGKRCPQCKAKHLNDGTTLAPTDIEK